MNDRFKFRAVLHQNKYEEYLLENFSHQRVFDVMSINLGIEYSIVEIIAEYPNGDWAVREIDDKDIDLIQCTGFKDKNGKLIYEGDIVKSFHVSSTMQGRVFTGFVSYDNERCRYCISENKHCGYVTFSDTDDVFEVIGNIYENKDLLNENS